jgi:hypothetical protein
MMTVVRRDFRSIPYRDAASTWVAIVELLASSQENLENKKELEAVAGIVCSVIADKGPSSSPIVVTCDGPRTRIYCIYDDDALDTSNGNESKLGFDALEGEWLMSLPVEQEDFDWVKTALKKHSNRIVPYNVNEVIENVAEKETTSKQGVILDIEGFWKS